MATIVPMSPTPTRAGKDALGGSVGRGLADIVGRLAEKRRQEQFSSAVQQAIQSSKNQNEFVGKVARFAKTPQEISELYGIAEKAFPTRERVENVLQKAYDAETGQETSVVSPKGSPFTEKELRARGRPLTMTKPRARQQFYLDQPTLKVSGKKSENRPRGALTLEEHKRKYPDVGASPAHERVESVLQQVFDLETGQPTSVVSPKGSPFTEKELRARGRPLTMTKPAARKQFYLDQPTLKPSGKESVKRPSGTLTLEEHKRKYPDAGKRTGDAKPSKQQETAVARIRARNAALPPEQQIPVDATNIAKSIVVGIREKEIERTVKEVIAERFGDALSFGDKGDLATRAIAIAREMMWQDPTKSDIVEQAVLQAREEVQTEDPLAGLQDEKKEDEGGIGGLFRSFFGGDEDEETPENVEIPEELRGKPSEIGRFLNKQFGMTAEEAAEWLTNNRDRWTTSQP